MKHKHPSNSHDSSAFVILHRHTQSPVVLAFALHVAAPPPPRLGKRVVSRPRRWRAADGVGVATAAAVGGAVGVCANGTVGEVPQLTVEARKVTSVSTTKWWRHEVAAVRLDRETWA